VPWADVVLSVNGFAVEHSFVVPCLLERAPHGAHRSRNRLTVGDDASPSDIARALAEHLGAARIEMVGV